MRRGLWVAAILIVCEVLLGGSARSDAVVLAAPQQCANPSMVWPSCTPRGNAFLTPGGGGDQAPGDDTLLGTISRVLGGIL